MDLDPSGVELSGHLWRAKRTTDLPYSEQESVAVTNDRPLCSRAMDAEGVELEPEEVLTQVHRV